MEKCQSQNPQTSQSRTLQNPQYHSYIIVGAGIAGLQAAQILASHEKDFILLQASGKIGGRIATDYLGDIVKQMSIKYDWVNADKIKDVPIEMGATWVSNQHFYLTQMIRQFGLTLFPQYFDGQTIYGIDHEKYAYIQSMAEYYRPKKQKIIQLLNKIDNLSVNFSNFYKNKAGNIDFYNKYLEMYTNITVRQFIQRQLQDSDLVDLVCQQIQTMQCVSCSKVAILAYIQNNDSLQFLKFYTQKASTMIDGMRIKQGSISIINGLLNKINRILHEQDDNQINIFQRNSKFLHLFSPVQEIVNEITKQVIVKTKINEYFSCKKVFLAIPMAVAKKIKISKISKSKQLIFDNQEPGLITRKYYIFKQAFWRVKFSGNASFSSKFPFHQMTELSPKNLSCGILAFVFVQKKYEEFKYSLMNSLKEKQTCQEKQDKYFKKIIADMFCVQIESQHLKETITYTRTFTYNQFIQSSYQSITKSKVWELVEALGDDYIQSYHRDQYNISYIGSDCGISDEFGTYMEGGIRNSRAKVQKVLGVKDKIRIIN